MQLPEGVLLVRGDDMVEEEEVRKLLLLVMFSPTPLSSESLAVNKD